MSKKETPSQIILLDSRSVLVRLALVAAVLFVLFGVYFIVRWQLGKLVAEAAVPSDKNFLAVARLSKDFAPFDPYTNWIVGSAERNNFSADTLFAEAQSFERAVRLSPNDFRYWLDFGRAREQKGEINEAEAAMRRAVELAPNYAYPRWLFGNFLLRQGKTAEAKAEFRIVAETHSTLRQQVFYLIWENTGQNSGELEKIVGERPQVRAALAVFYAEKNLPDDCLRLWQSLSAEEKKQFVIEGKTAAAILGEKQNYRAALNLLKELEIAPNAEIGQIENGGFENDIAPVPDSFLGWTNLTRIKNLSVSRDASQKKEGKLSLRLTFSGYSEPILGAVSQYVVIEPAKRYRLSFQLKTGELKSAGTPVLEIVEARSGKMLTASHPFPDGTTEWQRINLEFTSPGDSQAILIRTGRAFCGEKCPIVGSVWYDEFKLEQIGNAGK